MTTREPLVSIILCVYKVERLIRRSARSVFGQTYPNIEFIFVDDGSPDRSVNVLEELLSGEFRHLQSRVRIIRQENTGLAPARLAGLRAAKGDYILFIDPDDWCRTTQVEKLVLAAVKNDADMVICNYFNAYHHYFIPRREKRYETRTEMLRALLCHHHLRGYLWNKLIRRELYTDASLYFPETCHCEDLVRVAQAIWRARKIVYIRDRLIFYNRVNPNSVSKQSKVQKTIDVIRNIMGMYMHYYGREDFPFQDVEEPMLLSVISQVLRLHATNLFDEFPVLLPKCAPLIARFPSREFFEDIPRRTQLEMKAQLENLSTK